MSYRLGLKMRDKVTGLTGIITGKTEYITGCVQYCLRPPVGVDGKMPDVFWIDEIQLEVMGEGICLQPAAIPQTTADIEKPIPQPMRPLGGPRSDAPPPLERRAGA